MVMNILPLTMWFYVFFLWCTFSVYTICIMKSSVQYELFRACACKVYQALFSKGWNRVYIVVILAVIKRWYSTCETGLNTCYGEFEPGCIIEGGLLKVTPI